jgi:hypothetical protein
MEAERRTYQPTYQSVLINALNDVVNALNNGSSFDAWRAIKTLYDLLPPECSAECKPAYDEVYDGIGRIHADTRSGIDKVGANMKFRYYLGKYLAITNRKLLIVFKNSLHKHGYLEKVWQPLDSGDFKDLEKQQKESEE